MSIIDLTIDNIPLDHPGWDRLLDAVLAEDWAPINDPFPPSPRWTGVRILHGASNAARIPLNPGSAT